MSENALTTIEQKQIDFYNNNIPAILSDNGRIYIPIRPICEAIGVDWSAQRKRIVNDSVLSEMSESVAVTATDSRQTRQIQMLALPLEYINGWLFGINAKRVNPEVREPLLRYQRDCYRVLATAFNDSRFARLRQLYKKQGRDDEWIGERLKSIAYRNELTDEWKSRGVESDGYSLLTDAISKGAFGLTTAEHKELKVLEEGHNLRDHMSALELAVNSLGALTTTEIARRENTQGFEENLGAARRGGRVAGAARKEIESEIGGSIVTGENFLPKHKQKPLLDTENDHES